MVGYAAGPEVLSRVPARLRAWLSAARAEFLAAAGDSSGALRSLDRAQDFLPAGDMDPELPYVMLNAGNLARWRGNCLARLGYDEAIDELTAALSGAQKLSSHRAESGLRVDLALAFRKRGDIAMSVEHATRAAELAGSAGSARQRARIARLLSA
jgi:tetratricopeptide (TPR) repeat protein